MGLDDEVKSSFWNRYYIIIFSLIFVILIIMLPLINYFIFKFGWDWPNSIALSTGLISIMGIFYNNYKTDLRLNHQIKLNNHDLLMKFNYDDMKKSILEFKKFLKETIQNYHDLKGKEKQNSFDVGIENHREGYIKLMNVRVYKINKIKEKFPYDKIPLEHADKIKNMENQWYEYYYEMNEGPDTDKFGNPVDTEIKFIYISYYLRRLVESLENIEMETFFDFLPTYLQENTIKDLVSFLNNVQTKYPETSDDAYFADNIITKIEDINSDLNLSKINEIIDNEINLLRF